MRSRGLESAALTLVVAVPIGVIGIASGGWPISPEWWCVSWPLGLAFGGWVGMWHYASATARDAQDGEQNDESDD
jgi:hypothetical protein